jgi:hypothetical protein
MENFFTDKDQKRIPIYRVRKFLYDYKADDEIKKSFEWIVNRLKSLETDYEEVITFSAEENKPQTPIIEKIRD